MGLTGVKLKNDVLDKLEKEGTRSTKEKDHRFLEYYLLGGNEKIDVIFLPDSDGNLYKIFKKHGYHLNAPKAGQIRCLYESTGESCPICLHYMDGYQEADKTNDTAMKKHYSRFKAKDYHIWQAVIVDSDIDIEYKDDNLVKLIYLPSSIQTIIKQARKDGDVNDPTETVFRIKKTLTGNYYTSRFVKEFTKDNYGEKYDNLIEAFDNNLIRPYKFDELDIVPSIPTEDECKQWLDNAIEIVEGESTKQNSDGSSKFGDKINDKINEMTSNQKEESNPDDSDESTEKSDEGSGSGMSKAEEIKAKLRSRNS